MPILVKAPSTEFDNCPAGTHKLVCVDVIDLGDLASEYMGQVRMKPFVQMVFESEMVNPKNGKRFAIWWRMPNSVHEKSIMGGMLKSWLGRVPPTGFDLEKLIGRNGIASVVHNESGGKMYANIQSIAPLMGGMAEIVPSPDYKRRGTDKPAASGEPAEYHLPTDEEIQAEVEKMGAEGEVPF